jgi:hypothetical protein
MGGISRCGFGGAGIGLGAGMLLPSPLFAERTVATDPKPLARVIVDNDFAGDPDGLAALAYQLVAPTTRTVLVTTSALDAKLAGMAGTLPARRTAARGAELAEELVGLARIGDPPLVVAGAETFGGGAEQVSKAALAIVAEARKADGPPLILTCGGPLTNVAAALRIDPSISQRMTVIWIGGRADAAGGEEYNLSTDPIAARQVIEDSKVPLWQVPIEAYAPLLLSRSEMADDLRPISPLTAWLYEKLIDLPPFVPPTGVKGIGDCALVPLAALSGDCGRHSNRPARHIRSDLTYGDVIPGRSIRLYTEIDDRLMTADMLASFRLHAKAGPPA